MQATEGRLGRVFILRLDDGENIGAAVEKFAVERGIMVGQVMVGGQVSGVGLASGLITPDASGSPRLVWSMQPGESGGAEIVVQEIIGVTVQRVRGQTDVRETLYITRESPTKVMNKPAPVPAESGPGTVPVYVFNAEFN